MNGLPFLHYYFKYLARNNIKHVVIAVGYLQEQIINYFQDTYEGISITYSRESHPLGTGGATIQATKYLKTSETFLLLNGDSLHLIDLNQMIRTHLMHNAIVTVSATIASQNQRYGKIKLDSDFRVLEYCKERASVGDYCNSGMYLFNHDAFHHEPKNIVSCIDKKIIKNIVDQEGEAYCYPSDKYFIDIGLPVDYEIAQKQIPILMDT